MTSMRFRFRNFLAVTFVSISTTSLTIDKFSSKKLQCSSYRNTALPYSSPAVALMEYVLRFDRHPHLFFAQLIFQFKYLSSAASFPMLYSSYLIIYKYKLIFLMVLCISNTIKRKYNFNKKSMLILVNMPCCLQNVK